MSELRDWLIDYSNQVIGGEIVACQKHKWACMRFLRDIQRENTDIFPYIFDEEKALRFLEWMTYFKHTKGKLQGTNIEPAPIQIFNFSNLYGWIHRDTGLRRFRKFYWQVGRKNAKSQSLACVGSYEAMALGENMSEVYIGATKTEQSKIVWNEIKAQLNKCPDLKGKFRIAYGKIEHLKSGSYVTALSQDAGKTGDGFNPQCGIIDEYHAHPTSEIYDVLVSGMGARSQPLAMIITTAGFNLIYPCYSVEYVYVSKILDPNVEVENDEYFVMINELDKDDDVKDETKWEKANPILCSYEEGIRYIRGELKAALDVPEKMRNYLTKNMNIWVDRKDNGYMAMDKWKACGATKDDPFPDVTGLEATVGIDLSAVLDLTSTSFEIPLPDGRIAVMSHSFIPEDTLEIKRRSDKVRYDLWVEQGWITATPGAEVDYHFVLDYIIKVFEKYNWPKGEACFDRYLATWLMHELDDAGFIPVDIAQGIPTLSEPTKDFRAKVYSKKVIHDNNPVLSWAISNAVTRVNAQECIMLDKSKSTERIDPAAALMNAHVRVLVKESKVSVYETRGVRG